LKRDGVWKAILAISLIALNFSIAMARTLWQRGMIDKKYKKSDN
jgi:hypothetical protein